ncbi:hypothetical protein [Corynebacterium sp. 335C]
MQGETMPGRLGMTAGAVARAAADVAGRAERAGASWTAVPPFAATAAGAGFAGHGARLAAAVEAMRARGVLLAGRLAGYAPGVAAQFAEFGERDDVTGTRLTAVPRPGEVDR